MLQFELAALAALLLSAEPAPARQLSLSEKLASDLMESRRCETVPENDFIACHYTYRGLLITRYQTKLLTPYVSVERLEPPMDVTVYSERSACMSIGISADTPEGTAAVWFNVGTGKFYLTPRECSDAGAKKAKK